MDEYIDERDGNTYKIVQIGKLYWFAENLKYAGIEHYFPDRNSENVEKYGYLYTWNNAVKACPAGWRLPTQDDFEELLSITRAGDNSSCVRDMSWENSPNTSGFSALPAGIRWYDGVFDYFGFRACFWSVTPFDDAYAYYLYVHSGHAGAYVFDRNNALSVRYVKEI